VTQQPAARPVTIEERPGDLTRALAPVIGAPGRAGKPAAHPVVVLTVLCVAQFIAALDLFIVNVALPKIGIGVGATSLSNLSWVLNGPLGFPARPIG